MTLRVNVCGRRVQNMNDSFDRQTTYCVPKGGPRDFCSFCRQNALQCRLYNSVECSDATKHAQQCQQKHSMTGDQIENRIEILSFNIHARTHFAESKIAIIVIFHCFAIPVILILHCNYQSAWFCIATIITVNIMLNRWEVSEYTACKSKCSGLR